MTMCDPATGKRRRTLDVGGSRAQARLAGGVTHGHADVFEQLTRDKP